MQASSVLPRALYLDLIVPPPPPSISVISPVTLAKTDDARLQTRGG